MALAWFYSSQALAKPSGLPHLLFGIVSGLGREGVIELLDVVEHPDCFVGLLSTVFVGQSAAWHI